MKRIVIIICLTFSVAAFAQAQGLEKILKAFQTNPAVTHQTLGKEFLNSTLSRQDSSSGNMAKGIIDKISNIEIYALQDLQHKNPGDILKAIDEYKDGDGYETLLSVNKEGKNVRIVAHKNSESDIEITILASTESKIALVKLQGGFSVEDIMRIVNEQGNKL